MAAIVQHGYGSTDVLHLETVDMPVIGDDDVLIRVRAAALNHADWVYTSGRPLIARLAFGLRAPKDKIRGKDVAGRVDAVGRNVTRFRPGDEVYGELESGGFAEYARVPERMLAHKPANLTFEQAAAVPLSGNTALQGLRDVGKVRPGQTVLVIGASGGVGSFAVQIATALGARVTGVCSARNASLVRSLGADRVVEYTHEDFTKGRERYDLIFDLIGDHSVSSLRRVLTRKGTLVLANGTGGPILGPLGRTARALLLSPFVGQSLRLHAASRSPERLDQLRELIEAGAIVSSIDRAYPLAETSAALRYFVEEHARGKIVITV